MKVNSLITQAYDFLLIGIKITQVASDNITVDSYRRHIILIIIIHVYVKPL